MVKIIPNLNYYASTIVYSAYNAQAHLGDINIKKYKWFVVGFGWVKFVLMQQLVSSIWRNIVPILSLEYKIKGNTTIMAFSLTSNKITQNKFYNIASRNLIFIPWHVLMLPPMGTNVQWITLENHLKD